MEIGSKEDLWGTSSGGGGVKGEDRDILQGNGKGDITMEVSTT